MPLQRVHKSCELIKSGNESDINVALTYAVTIRYIRESLFAFIFDTEGRYFLIVCDLTYIESQICRVFQINDKILQCASHAINFFV